MKASIKDFERRSMPLEEWPVIDQQLWAAASHSGDVLDDGGRAARWAGATREARMGAYGRWLTFLHINRELDPGVHPGDRATPSRVALFIELLRSRCASMTVWSQVDRLHAVLSVLSPRRDWRWLRRTVNRLGAMAKPLRPTELLLRPAEELIEEGIRRATLAKQATDLPPRAQAVVVRDGLTIALLTACPIRRRSFAGLTIDRHIIRHRDGSFMLNLEPSDVKNGVSLDFPLPQEVCCLLALYLDTFRPRLAGHNPTRLLWMTRDGQPFSIHTISERIKKLTERWLDAPMSMHLFRHAAVTSMATDAPEHARLIAALLGHQTLRTAERHYNKARAIEAARSYHKSLEKFLRACKAQHPVIR